jgi:hypothetical protein
MVNLRYIAQVYPVVSCRVVCIPSRQQTVLDALEHSRPFTRDSLNYNMLANLVQSARSSYEELLRIVNELRSLFGSRNDASLVQVILQLKGTMANVEQIMALTNEAKVDQRGVDLLCHLNILPEPRESILGVCGFDNGRKIFVQKELWRLEIATLQPVPVLWLQLW